MKTWLSLAVMIVVIYCVRMLPMVLLRKEIRNIHLRSFLFYVPYVTLAVMTFPAIIQATEHPVAGLLALIAGLIAAWMNKDLFIVAACCCVTVFLSGLVL